MDGDAGEGGSVLRPAGPWTESVHALLMHVRARGVPWVPEPRGVDRRGRAEVSWVDGDVPAYPMPDWVWAPAVLDERGADAARAARRDRRVRPAGRTWALPPREPDEVVCHNDFAPYNLAFRDGLPVGAIDFEAAAPGPRAWDLAYLSYRIVPLAAPGNPDLPAQPDPPGRLAATVRGLRGHRPGRRRSRSCPSACSRSPRAPRRATRCSTARTRPTWTR